MAVRIDDVYNVARERGIKNFEPLRLTNGSKLVPEMYEHLRGNYVSYNTLKNAAEGAKLPVLLHPDTKREYLIVFEIKENAKSNPRKGEFPHEYVAVVVPKPWTDFANKRFVFTKRLEYGEDEPPQVIDPEEFMTDKAEVSMAFEENYLPDLNSGTWTEHLMADPAQLAFGNCEY